MSRFERGITTVSVTPEQPSNTPLRPVEFTHTPGMGQPLAEPLIKWNELGLRVINTRFNNQVPAARPAVGNQRGRPPVQRAGRSYVMYTQNPNSPDMRYGVGVDVSGDVYMGGSFNDGRGGRYG